MQNEMRNRLVELLKKADENASDKLITDYEDAIQDNAEYLIENGVIVPPCKVGDTVYVHWGHSHDKSVYPVKVYALRFDTKKNNMRICVEGNFKITAYGGSYTHFYNGTFAWNSVGKTVFLTKEEAEQKLRKEDEGK